MLSEKPGFHTIISLQAISTGRKEFINPLPDLFRLWIVRDNLSIPNTDLEAGDLAHSLCFYPLGYRPDISYEYLHGYAVWFDHHFVASNPQLQRFAELLSHWHQPTVTIRRQEVWYQPFLATCLAQEFIDQQNPSSAEIYRYLHCTLIGNYLCDLFSSSIPWLAPANQLSHLSSQFLELVDRHFIDQHRPKFYIDALHTSESNLFKRCRQELHKSPGDVIYFRLIKEAKYLLSHTLLSGKEIAAQLNFNSYAYFCERFKEATSLTPQTFRKLNHYHQ